LLLGGVGSGKTWCGAHWAINKVYSSPDSIGLITANTYSQLQKATLHCLFQELDRLHIPYIYNKQSTLLTIAGVKKFYCLSLDSYNNHRGIEIGEWWGDEVAYNSEESFQVMSGRLRDSRGNLDVLFTTTPKGFNWLHKYFHPDGEKHTAKYSIVSAATYNNRHLPQDYIDALSEQYDEKLIAQELGGEFVNVSTGRIYYAFNRSAHAQEFSQDPRYPIWIGMDFNVNPMTASVGQVIGDVLYIFDEFFLKDSNTPAMCAAITAKYGKNATIVPDSTGNKTTTNSNRSDHKILKDAGFTVKSATNPFRVDRYAAVNGAFSNGKVVISSKCKYTIKDLENVSYKEGTDKPETDDPSLTHISDALGYLIYRTVNPLQNKSRQIRSQLK